MSEGAVRPCARGKDQFLATVHFAACFQFEFAVEWADGGDGGVIPDRGSVCLCHAEMGGVAFRGGSDAAFALVEGDGIVRQTKLGPAAHGFGSVQYFKRNACCGQTFGVIGDGDFSVGWREVKATSFEDQFFASIGLQGCPGRVGLFSQFDVLRGVVGEADDSRMVLGAAAHVTDFELFQAKNIPFLAGKPIQCATSEAA